VNGGVKLVMALEGSGRGGKRGRHEHSQKPNSRGRGVQQRARAGKALE
jgi:hypothetical protein